jgi:pSer/pThr/pTyr-binding forkhead associated (FHA) protein
VSGLHARLSLLGEGLEIADLGSTNGTFVGDAGGPLRPNAPVTLAFGEVVRIGPQVRLTVHLAENAQLNEARP